VAAKAAEAKKAAAAAAAAAVQETVENAKMEHVELQPMVVVNGRDTFPEAAIPVDKSRKNPKMCRVVSIKGHPPKTILVDWLWKFPTKNGLGVATAPRRRWWPSHFLSGSFPDEDYDSWRGIVGKVLAISYQDL